MNLIPLALACVLAVAPNAVPALQASPPRAEDQITQLEILWNEAHLHGDADTLDRLWAPGLTVTVPGMPVFSKTDLLTMWRSMKVAFAEYATHGVRIAVSGHTAVVTGSLHRSRDFGGRVASEDWLFTKTYAEIDGQWRVLAYHASVGPPP